ncbi:MAG: hypothetical protein IPJ61_16700 [Tessaracoccus sp.]|uniref:NADase-type glycan-binding domain-containing protein n=1 Tax=Tessaracoccus sp. TaxID=1971211 RepID=UPI001EB0B740|nr:hypothetical protein [Tessaracoccus sp.]MBK7822651.1 hypothetical protein [Tessaracoccus sp.]
MVQRVPDEYFRKRTAESAEVREDDSSGRADERPRRPRPPRAPGPRRRRPAEQQASGIAPSLLIVPIVLAVIVGFLIGRLLPNPLGDPKTPVPSVVSPGPVVDVAVSFDSPVAAVAAQYATGECRDGAGGAPATLLDDDPNTVWRCPGDGVGEVIDFTFDQPVHLVGIRLVNGNTAVPDRFLAERRITAIRWMFADGSFFDQGFAPSESSPQEVRFPETTTALARMEILSSLPGEDEDTEADSVSISSLEFLARA